MNKFFSAIATCMLLVSVLSGFGQKRIDIEKLSFMTGRWTLSHQWGEMEENWSLPSNNTMICSYKCVKDGKPQFYEFIIIEQTDSVPVMTLRHFGPGNIAWEEKDQPNVYPLAELRTDFAKFERPDKKLNLTFARTTDKLTVTLSREKNGQWQEDIFPYSLTR